MGKKVIKKVDYDEKKYSGYLFHYTDAISAFTTLFDGRMYPYALKTPSKSIALTSLPPTTNDITLIKSIYNLSNDEIDNNDLRSYFGKMQYAFGFKFDDIKPPEETLFNRVYNITTEIDLVPIRFILVRRCFRFTTRAEYENEMK